jgi:folate-binding protein YgfZ
MDNETQSSTGIRGIFWWKPAALLRVSGEDSATFLQGQFTNDLRGVTAEAPVYGLWLNHKGRVLADSFVGRFKSGEFWICSYSSPVAVIRERLEAFVIADDVTLEDVTAEWAGATLIGNVTLPAALAAGASTICFQGRRGNIDAREYLFPITLVDMARQQSSKWDQIPLTAMERLRIEAALVSVPNDIGPGELPNEGRLDRDAVSYTKGCYLGQEVMARLKAMGQVRRRLMKVAGRGAIPLLPAPLFQGDKRVGELRSTALIGEEFIGLALISLLNVRSGEGLSFTSNGQSPVTIIDTL